MMWLRALGAAVLAGVGFYAAWVWQGQAITALEAENAAISRSLVSLNTQYDLSKVARAVDAARAERETQQARDAANAIEAILTAEFGECADAPLDPAITDILDGLLGRSTD